MKFLEITSEILHNLPSVLEFTCDNCNSTVSIPRSRIKKKFKQGHKQCFCSVSCANRYKPRRSLEGKCKICSTAIKSELKYCSDKCRKEGTSKNIYNYETITLEEIQYTTGPRRSKNAAVNSNARSVYFKNIQTSTCNCCGYIGHIDVCHIKPISQFDITSLVSEINDIANLVGLCKRCHWELDKDHNGDLQKLYSAHEPIPIYI